MSQKSNQLSSDAKDIVTSYVAHKQTYNELHQKKKNAETAKKKKIKEFMQLMEATLAEKQIDFPQDRKKELFSRTLRLLSGEETVMYMKRKSSHDKFFNYFNAKLKMLFKSINIQIDVDNPNKKAVLKKLN